MDKDKIDKRAFALYVAGPQILVGGLAISASLGVLGLALAFVWLATDASTSHAEALVSLWQSGLAVAVISAPLFGIAMVIGSRNENLRD